MQNWLMLFITLTIFISCKSPKVKKLETQLGLRSEQVEDLNEQVDHLRKTNASLLDRMSDLSIVNKEGAESIKESLKSIGQQYSFIENITDRMQTKDSINLVLVQNLKRSLADMDDEDVQVEVKGGVVYVSLSDKMLFRSGSSRLTNQALGVLEKIGLVINDHDELNVMVEGHTDNVPINNDCTLDNWDLSVKRATSVVRVLQTDYYVSPERLTAAGRSEYLPKADNTYDDGKSLNRRTEIIFMPRLDQFFELLEPEDMLN